MGTGRSGLPRGVRDITTKVKSNNLNVQSWQSKSVQEAGEYYKNLRSKYDSNDLYDQGLNSNMLQRLVADMNMHERGVVLPDADFDDQVLRNALNGVELYRGASQRAIDSIMYGDLSYMGDGIHGDGLYFSTSARTAQEYGVKQTTAYIDKGLASVIKENSLRDMLSNESAKTQQLFKGNSGLSAYALYKGYNVIHAPGGNGSRSVAHYGITNGVDYYIPLTREVLVFREHNRKYNYSKWKMS